MAEGTNVGSVYLDFVVRDTLGRQLNSMAQKASSQMNGAFAKIGTAAGDSYARAIDKGFSKSLEMAKANLARMEGVYKAAEDRLMAMEERRRDDYTMPGQDPAIADALMQESLARDKAYQRMAQAADTAYQRMQAARDRVAVESQALAYKQAQAEENAAQKAADAQERASQKMTASQDAAAQSAGAAQEAAAQRTLSAWQMVQQAMPVMMSGAAGLIKGALSGAVSLVKRGVLGLGSAFVKVFRIGGNLVSSLAGKLKELAGHAHGAGRGMQSIGSRLKSIVSGALIFNGISAALRKMTQYLGNAIMSSGQMQSAMANLKGAAATAASPIISALTPALAALANAAATVFSWLSRLFSLLTGKSVKSMQSAAASVGGYGAAAGGAAKKVKELAKATNTLGLDELNVVQPEEDDSGGGGGGGGGGGAELPNYDFSGTTPFLEALMDAIKAGDYEQVGALFAEKLNGALASIPWEKIDKTVRGWANNIARVLNGFVAGLDWTLVGTTIGNGLNVGLHAVDAFVDRFNWGDLGAGIARGLNGAVATLDWPSLGRLLTDKLRVAVEMLFTFVRTFDWNALGSSIADMIDAACANVDWAQAGQGISGLVKGLLDTLLVTIQETNWGKVGEDFGTMLANIDWGGILGRIGLVILAAGGALLEAVGGLFKGLATQCGDGFFGGLLQGFANIFTWLKEHIVDPLVNGIKELLGIHSPSTVFEDFGINLVLGLLGGLSGIWHKITGFFTDKLGAIKTKVGGAWDSIKQSTSEKWGSIKTFIGDTWDNIKTKSSSTFDNVKTKVLGAWTGIKNGIKEKINNIIRFMNGLLQGAANMVNRMIDILNGFAIDVPEWAQGAVGTDRFGFNLSHVNAPQIPELANGGIIKQPTLAMMGEYAGAAGNPEIVSPRSMMRDVFDESVSPLVAALKELIAYLRENAGTPLLREQLAVLQAILDKELTVQIGDETIGRAASRYESNRGVRLNSSAFAEAY